jgi:hypothetical protein
MDGPMFTLRDEEPPPLARCCFGKSIKKRSSLIWINRQMPA